MDYRELNYISLTDVSIALVISMTLPSVAYGIYFHRKNGDNEEKEGENANQNEKVLETFNQQDYFDPLGQ